MAAPPPPRQPSALMDDLVEEILLRIQPDEPACLARAAVVCKRWCRLVTDPGFRRRFRQLHRTPALLGFIVRRHRLGATSFLPTSSFCPPDADCRDWYPLDARHGCLLFYWYCGQLQDEPDWTFSRCRVLIVWTPATGGRRELPKLWLLSHRGYYWNAALLCRAPGCDHMECPSGSPFNVILVGGQNNGHCIYAYVFSSEDDEWPMTAIIEQTEFQIQRRCTYSALVRNAVYFLLEDNEGILEYNTKKGLLVTGLPPKCNKSAVIVLMSLHDGRRLGFATVHDCSLCIWLRESAPTTSGGWTWMQHRVVDIKSFPRFPPSHPHLSSLLLRMLSVFLSYGLARLECSPLISSPKR